MADGQLQTHRVRLRLFGGCTLVTSEGKLLDVRSRRGRALVAYLAMVSDREVSRERISGLFWSDRSESQARASLRQCLMELRDALSEAGADILDVDRQSIALRPGSTWSDVAELRRLLAGQDADGLTALLSTIGSDALLSGFELSGLFQDWLDQERPALEGAIATGVQRHLDRLESAGAWHGVRALAEAYLKRDSLDEPVIAAAIRADAALGATAAAHRRFHALQTALAREFGSEPGAVAREALARIQAGETRRPGSPGPPAAPAPIPDSLSPPVVIVAAFDTAGEGGPDDVAREIRDEVLNGLSRFRDLRVVSDPRTIDDLPYQEVADEGGTYALGGAYRPGSVGGRLTVRLTRLRDGEVIWSDRLDGAGGGLVGAIDAVIAKVIGAVLPTISADLVRHASNLPHETIYRRYVLARDKASRARTYAEASAAARDLEALIADAPDFALPHLPLASLYNTDFGYTRALSSTPALRARALELAKTALTLDRKHVHGYTIAGWSYLRRRQWEPAKMHFDQALVMNSYHPKRVLEVAYGIFHLGEVDRARKLFDRHLLLNPEIDDYYFMDLGLMSFLDGEYDLAASYLELIATPDVWGHLYRALNARALGSRVEEATAAAKRAIEAIWPQGTPMTTAAVAGWMVSHHPFRSLQAEHRLVGAVTELLSTP